MNKKDHEEKVDALFTSIATRYDFINDIQSLGIFKKVEAEIYEGSNSSLKEIDLEIDGGINFENIQSVIDAGANMIVAGTTTFNGGPDQYANNIEKLRGH